MVTYLVQARLHEHSDSYHDFAEVPSSVVSVIIEGLLPGNNYDVRVLSVNEAGATPSDDITIAMPPTGECAYEIIHCIYAVSLIHIPFHSLSLHHFVYRSLVSVNIIT